MKENLISRDDVRKIHPAFSGKYGETLINWSLKISGLNYANEIYNKSKHLTGPAFCTDLLDKLGMERVVVNGEILDQYKDTPFITVSNHPCGHVDGIAVIETVGSRVSNYKLLVNFILGLVDTMSENFITVDPIQADKSRNISIGGLKESISHIKHGNQLGFFPSGAVSNLIIKNGRLKIEDREWQPSVIKIIKRAHVPVIPIHISTVNSQFFYLLRLFGWKIRNLRLCHELYNKKGKVMIITVGQPILPAEIAKYDDIKELGEFFKSRTYALSQSK